MTKIEKRLNAAPSPFGTDVYRSIVRTNTLEAMKEAAELVGLTIGIRGEEGDEYSFKHPLEPKMCSGVLKEGKVLVEINFSSNPNIMPEFWKKVKEIRLELNSQSSS